MEQLYGRVRSEDCVDAYLRFRADAILAIDPDVLGHDGALLV